MQILTTLRELTFREGGNQDEKTGIVKLYNMFLNGETKQRRRKYVTIASGLKLGHPSVARQPRAYGDEGGFPIGC